MTETDFLTSASEHFLTEPYPNDVILWSNARKEEYIKTHIWERYEYESALDIRDSIEDYANQLKHFYQQGLKDGKEKP